MKNSALFILILISIFTISNCSDNENINNISNGEATSYIRGTIENWQSGRMNLKAIAYYEDDSSHNYYVLVLDSTFIEADRSFVFKLTAPVINQSDSFYFPNYGNCGENPIVTPVNAKFKSLSLHVYNSNDTAIGFINLSDADTNIPPVNAAFFLYSSENATVQGTRECTMGSNIITSEYNLTFSKGWWNPVNWHTSYIDSTHIYESYKNNTTVVLHWRYQMFLYP